MGNERSDLGRTNEKTFSFNRAPRGLSAICRAAVLSDHQLKTVIYSGDAHGGFLAGAWTVGETFHLVTAAREDMPHAVPFRQGFMPGDGTGAGKSRQSSGSILDN